MKNKKRDNRLTERENELMQFFWNCDKPVTSNEILEMCTERTWSDTYLLTMLHSLEEKEMIEVVGMVKYGKTYARQFKYKITREEYAAALVTSIGIDLDSIENVAVAMVGESKKSKSKNAKAIKRLEEIVKKLGDSSED